MLETYLSQLAIYEMPGMMVLKAALASKLKLWNLICLSRGCGGGERAKQTEKTKDSTKSLCIAAFGRDEELARSHWHHCHQEDIQQKVER